MNAVLSGLGLATAAALPAAPASQAASAGERQASSEDLASLRRMAASLVGGDASRSNKRVAISVEEPARRSDRLMKRQKSWVRTAFLRHCRACEVASTADAAGCRRGERKNGPDDGCGT